MGWTKAKTLAEKIATGDLSFESIVNVLEEAVAYGRIQERAAVKRRVLKDYKISDWGDLATPEIREHVTKAIDGA